MTKTQIENLTAWLQENKELRLSIGTWGERVYLRLRTEDDEDCFYILLSDDDKKLN